MAKTELAFLGITLSITDLLICYLHKAICLIWSLIHNSDYFPRLLKISFTGKQGQKVTLLSCWLMNEEVSETCFPTFHLHCHTKQTTVQEMVANDYIKKHAMEISRLIWFIIFSYINIHCLMKFIFSFNHQYFSRNILRPQRCSKPVLLTGSKSAISLLTVWKQIITSCLGFFEATSFSAIKVPVSQMFEHLIWEKDFALAKRGNSEEGVKG